MSVNSREILAKVQNNFPKESLNQFSGDRAGCEGTQRKTGRDKKRAGMIRAATGLALGSCGRVGGRAVFKSLNETV